MIMETLRTSSYMIPVKLENEEGKYMLIHGYTGAIDVVSEDVLTRIKNIASAKEFSEAALQTLLKRGYLTMKSQKEEYAYVARMAKALHKKCDVLYTTFTWVVTYNCNFRCPYCFEERSKKDDKCRIVFTKEQVDLVYNIMNGIQPYKELRKNVITLYGGEPLLADNKEIVNYIVEEGKKRGYTFVAVTNGYELDCFLNLLSIDAIYKLQITIDGLKEIHDQRRVHYKDGGTFDKIVSNVGLALERNVEVVVRMNADNKNIDQFKKMKDYFQSKGFFDYPKFEFYAAILKDNDYVTVQEHEDMSFLSPQSFLKKQREQNDFTESSICRNVYNALSEKKPIAVKSVSCASQVSGYVIDPVGGIYPCWEVIGKKEHLEGTYSKNGIVWNKSVVDKWKHTDISQLGTCKQCKYALLCGGGCPYHRMLNQNLSCAFFKRSFIAEVNKAYAKFINNV